MAQSPEYPEFRWMPPRSFTRGRNAGMPHLIVIHTTEGSEGPHSAEDGAAYDQRRTDGTSAHFYVDSNSIVQCVRTTDKAHGSAWEGNNRGIQIEVCGRAGQSAAQWDDPVSRATIAQVARLCRRLRQKYPFPLVNLTPAQIKAGKKGFCEHKDISQAWGQTDHWDPGPRFPWAKMFAQIDQKENDIVTTQAEFNKFMVNALKDPAVAGLMKALPWQYIGRGIGENDTTPEGNVSTLHAFNAVLADTAETTTTVRHLREQVTALTETLRKLEVVVSAVAERIDADADVSDGAITS